MHGIDWAGFAGAVVAIIGAIAAATVTVLTAIHNLHQSVTAAKEEVKTTVAETTAQQTQDLTNGKGIVS